MKLRICVVTTHPIQYQAPIFRTLEKSSSLTLTVVFGSDQGINRKNIDPGFQKAYAWDIDLLDGYDSLMLHENSINNVHSWRFDTPNLDKTLDAVSPDCVIVFGWNKRYYWRAYRWAWKNRVPVLVRGDSNLKGHRPWYVMVAKRIILSSFFSRIDGFLFVGKYNRELYEHYGVSSKRLFYAPHSVDNEYFRAEAAKNVDCARALREELGIGDGGTLFLFVGKLCSYKRPLDVIAAFSRIADRNSRLLFVGDGPLSSLCKLAGQEDPFDRVHFVGFKNQSKLPVYYAASDALILPSSTKETWGLVANEAMACAVPCVLSEGCGSAPDLIVPGESGFTFPVGGIQQLSKIMVMVSKDAELRLRMKRAAEQHVKKFSLKKTVIGISDAIFSVTSHEAT